MNIKINNSLIKQAILAKQANKRQATSNTKTRAEVSGGGKKPWKQKGTGRARAGSSRSPIWVGGGITFGPRSERNYKTKLPQKMAKAALNQLLQILKSDNRLINGGKLELKEPKTKLAIILLDKLGLSGKKVIFVTENTVPELVLACGNLQNIEVIRKSDLSIIHLVSNVNIVMDEKTYQSYFPTATKPKASAKKTQKEDK